MIGLIRRFAARVVTLLDGFPDLQRRSLVRAYIKGRGIEIGARHRPLKVSSRARVTYVDRLWVPGLQQQHPELASRKLAPVDIVDDIEKLTRFPDESQDFVIANHVLEHCQNPIGALLNFLRVLRRGGILYLAVLDDRYTLNRARPVTSLEHMLQDHERGPEWSKEQHLEEWTRLVNGVQEPEEVAEQVTLLMSIDYDIQYHVLTQHELMEMLLLLRKKLNFEIEVFLKREKEILVILRKSDAPALPRVSPAA
jgi:predicted SAM-dependent methyltransferase